MRKAAIDRSLMLLGYVPMTFSKLEIDYTFQDPEAIKDRSGVDNSKF